MRHPRRHASQAKPDGTWREAYQSSPAAYDPLDPAFEKALDYGDACKTPN